MIEKLVNLNKEYKKFRIDVEKETELVLKQFFKEFFIKHSNIIKEIRWNQGYSVYNDSTYDYYEQPDYISFLINSNNPAIKEYSQLLNLKNTNLQIDVNVNTGETYDDESIILIDKLELKETVKEVMELLDNVNWNILIELFGSSVTVVASSKNISTETYFGEDM